MDLETIFKQAMQEAEEKEALIKQGVIPCDHSRTMGDNYGESCGICDKQLTGYGYRGKHRACIHRWGVIYGEPDFQICHYCETTRVKPNPSSDQESGVGASKG